MAAIFQIRRGSGSVALTDGELYLHKASGSLQVSLGTTPITLVRLDEINSGSLNLSGDITASNAYFKNNVKIDGNIILGDGANGDTIESLGVFTTNLIPQGNRDIGSTDAYWRNVYAASISGAIAATNGVISGSSQIDAFLPQGVVSGSSQVIGILSSLNTFSASTDISIENLNTFSGSQLNKDLTLATYTGSVETRFIEIGVVSGSLIDSASTAKSVNDSQDISITNLNSYTQSNSVNITELFATSSDHETRIDDLTSFTGSYATTGSNIFFGNQEVNGDISIIGGEFSVITGSGFLTSSIGFIHNTISPSQGSSVFEVRHINSEFDENFAVKLFADDYIAKMQYEKDNVTYDILQTNLAGDLFLMRDTRLFGTSLNIDENLIVTGSLIVATDVYSPSFSGSFTGSFSGSLATQDGRLDSLELTSQSHDSRLLNLEITSGSHNSRLNNLESKSASVDISLVEIHSYTASLKTAIDLSGQDVTVLGNLTVNGTTTQINSTQVNIGDNILELNFGGSSPEAGIYTKDETGASLVSGSLLWDSADGADFWKAGKKGLESKILLADGDNVLTSSLQLTEINNTTASLNQTTASLNDFSASVTSSLESVYQTNASLNLFSASVTASLESIYQTTASLNTYTQSVNSDLASIHQTSASTNLFSASVTTSLESIYQTTESLNLYTQSVNSDLASLHQTTASLNSFSASVNTSLESIYQTTASLNDFSASVTASLESIYQTTASLNDFSASVTSSLESIYQTTASLNDFSASVTASLESVYQTTSSLNDFSASVSFSLEAIYQTTASLNDFSASVTASLESIYQTTASLNTFTSSQLTQNETLLQVTASLITSASQLYVSTSLMTASVEDHEERIGYLESIGGISGGNPLTQLHIFSASAKLSIAELEGPFSTSVDARINELSQSSGYINYITNSVENLTGIEVADFDNNVAVTFINGTLKFIFGTPAIPTSIATSLSGFESDRFNNVNDAYIVNGTWSNQGYTLVSASLYEGSALLTQVGSGTSLSFSTTTSGSHTYRLEYTASSPLDGTLFTTSTTTTGTISKSNPASPTLTVIPTVQLGASGNQIEQGATGSISFTSSSADPSNGWDLVNTTTNVSTPYFVTGSATGSTSISITATANYESPTGDNIPDLTTTSTATTTYAKIRSLRHGASTAESFTEGDLANLALWDTTLGGDVGTIVKGTTNPSGQTITINHSGDKFHYIVYDSSRSNLSNITSSGFGVFGSFAVTTVGQYKIYKSTTLQTGGAGTSFTYTLT